MDNAFIEFIGFNSTISNMHKFEDGCRDQIHLVSLFERRTKKMLRRCMSLLNRGCFKILRVLLVMSRRLGFPILIHSQTEKKWFHCFPRCSPGATSLALGPLADRLNRVNLLLAVVILGSVPCALIKLLGFQEKCSVGCDSKNINSKGGSKNSVILGAWDDTTLGDACCFKVYPFRRIWILVTWMQQVFEDSLKGIPFCKEGDVRKSGKHRKCDQIWEDE